MRNSAKCRLCLDVLESFHQFDLVACKCGEISITGGNHGFGTSAKNYANFIRLDDENREIEVKFVEKEGKDSSGLETNKDTYPTSHDCNDEKPISKAEKLKML